MTFDIDSDFIAMFMAMTKKTRAILARFEPPTSYQIDQLQ